MASTTGLCSVALALACLALSGCKTPAPYVWVDALPSQAEPAEKEYVIQAGDQLAIRVWGQESMSARARVRSRSTPRRWRCPPSTPSMRRWSSPATNRSGERPRGGG